MAPTDMRKCDMPMSSVGQHHASGTPSGMYTVTKLREKMLSSAHLSHKVCAGTGRINTRVLAVTLKIPQQTWQDIECCLNVCRAMNGAHIAVF